MSENAELYEGFERVDDLPSGVELIVRPFPAGLWPHLQARSLEKYPDPPMPKKTIKVVDGTEEVDNPKDEDYIRACNIAGNRRYVMWADAALDICVEVDLERYAGEIKKLGKYADLPEDPDELRLAFLKLYALRSAVDRERVVMSAINQTVIGAPEVARRLGFFRREMEGPEVADDDAPGAAEEQSVEDAPQAKGA